VSRRRPGSEAFLIPAGFGAAGYAYATGAYPLVGVGLAGMGVLSMLPWAALTIVFLFSIMLQSHYLPFSLGGVNVGTVTLRPDMAVLIPLALRAYFYPLPKHRTRWRTAQYLFAAWIVLNFVTSKLHSPSFRKSIQPAGLLLLGFAALITIYVSVAEERRLRFVVRWFVIFGLFNSYYGLVATLGHYFAGTSFGVSVRSQFGAGTYGLMYEHDIFGSTCAVMAIVLYVLWREKSDLFSDRVYKWGFWVSLISMFAGLSRAAWLGFALAFFVVLVISRRNRRPTRLQRVAVGSFAVALAIVGAIWLVTAAQNYATTGYSKSQTKSGSGTGSVIDGVFQKVNELTAFSSGTEAARYSELRTALADVHVSPIFGLGTGTYGLRHPLKSGLTNYIGNLWLRVFYDTGMVGFLLFVGAVAITLFPTRTLLRAKGPWATLARALTFGWLPLIVAYAGTDDTLFMWPWVFLGLIGATRLVAERHERARRQAARTPLPPGVPVPARPVGRTAA